MRVVVLGVGDAWDADHPNSAVLVETGGFTLLIDCGPTVLPSLWRARPHPDAIDAIYLTHHHADHVGGLPLTLERWTWEGRTKPLTIATSEPGAALVRQLCALFAVTLGYRLDYALLPGLPALGPFALRTAPTAHAAPNLALRLEAGGRRLAYSGDGRPTPLSLALYRDVDLLLHECWEVSAPATDIHSDLETVRAIVGPPRIGLYHVRGGRRPALRAAIAGDPRLALLEPGEQLEP